MFPHTLPLELRANARKIFDEIRQNPKTPHVWKIYKKGRAEYIFLLFWLSSNFTRWSKNWLAETFDIAIPIIKITNRSLGGM